MPVRVQRSMLLETAVLFCAGLLAAATGQKVQEFSYYTLAVQHGAGFCHKNPT